MNIPGRCEIRISGWIAVIGVFFCFTFVHYAIVFINNLFVIYPDLNCLDTIPLGYLSDVYVETAITLPLASQMTSLSKGELACLFHRYVTTLQDFCAEPKRFGKVQTGGVNLCIDEPLHPRPPCTIVNFDPRISNLTGVQLNKNYNCSVYYFEKWNIRQSRNVRYVRSSLSAHDALFNLCKLGKGGILTADMLILPVRPSDDLMIRKMAKDGLFNDVVQLNLNFYLSSYFASTIDYMRFLVILRIFYDLDFRIFLFDRPWECAPLFGKLNHCYNVYLTRSSLSLTKEPSGNDVSKTGYSKEGQRGTVSEVELNIKDHITYISSKTLDIYNRYITSHQYLCKQIVRIGNIKDGGWDVCHDVNFRPTQNNCLVYSFGINHDWSFDDEVTKTYGCELYAFDPSMHIPEHRRSDHIYFYDRGLYSRKGTGKVFGKIWKVTDLKSMITELGHLNRTIDIVKLDIESSEKRALPEMLDSGALKNVVQLYIEFHNFRDLRTLQRLYAEGFRIYWTHQNPYSESSRNDEVFAKAIEVYFVNINMMKRGKE